MKLARHDLVAALQLRYDHYSSQSLFEAACKRANLSDQEHYTATEIKAFRHALSTIGDRLQRVDDRLDSLLGEAPPEPAKPAQAPQATAPSTEPAKPAQAPQATAPMPPSTESAKPAQAPQATAPMPAVSAEPAKGAQAPQTTAPMPAPSTEFASADETRIVLRGVEVADGDALFVCGDRAELGSWDPERARPMMRDGDAWIAVVPSGDGEFKFLRRTEDGDVTWEGGDNREIGSAVTIETSWQPRTK